MYSFIITSVFKALVSAWRPPQPGIFKGVAADAFDVGGGTVMGIPNSWMVH